MSCPHCEAAHDETPHDGVPGTARLLLVGPPNAGKSTLFNRLTGARQTVRNAPGTTVEPARGRCDLASVGLVDVVDLPGTYSLTPVSPDEQVTTDAVRALGSRDTPDDGAVVVVVAPATDLHGSLFLLGQTSRATPRIVVALTMTDVAAAHAQRVDPAALERELGVPVVPVDPRTGGGVDDLGDAVRLVAAHPRPVRGVPADPGSGPDDLADVDAVLGWADEVLTRAGATREPVRTTSDRIDRRLLTPWVGLPVFLATLWGLFHVATLVAAPLMGLAESLVTGPASALVTAVLSWVGLDGTWVRGLLVDGILAGVGVVVSFAPLMALMFLAIGLLEDSGYLARVAVLGDRMMRAVGLDGRVVMPLVVGFGCNLPALAATRTLPDARQRLLTALLVPYTSCPARLTVYLLVANVFFPRHTGLVLLAMYVLSVGLVVAGALVLRATLFRDVRAQPLAIVLPAYQVPRIGPLLRTVRLRVRAFLRGAATIIVAVLTVVWVLLAIPTSAAGEFGDTPVHDSVYGTVTDAIAPAFGPAGYGDWRLASSLVTGFVAKEVAVGALAQAYAVDEPGAGAAPGALGDHLRTTLETTSGGHPEAAAAAFMVFVLAYTPCLATVAEQRRLHGTRWALGAMVAQIAVAWVLSVATFRFLALWT